MKITINFEDKTGTVRVDAEGGYPLIHIAVLEVAKNLIISQNMVPGAGHRPQPGAVKQATGFKVRKVDRET